ncbi:MAG: MFS transporter [Nitrososphaeraceae archaeon]|nr:MFS transporter [Nitrososphaeraceae archaeon]
MQNPLKSKQNQNRRNEGLSTKEDSNLLASRGGTAIPRTAWKLLVILSSIATMVMYVETMLIPAIPDLINDFNVSYGTSSWILTTYLISGAVATPIVGKLSDVYGKKKVLLLVMLIYAIGVSFAGFASNIYTLLLVRAIQGIGMGMFPIAFGIIRDQFPREKISIGQGIISSMFAAGAAVGLSAGALIVENFGWQATFFTIIPIVILLLITIWRFVHIGENQQIDPAPIKDSVGRGKESSLVPVTNFDEKRKRKLQIDIKGAAALAVSITSFLLCLTLIETSSGLSTSNNSFFGILSAYGTIIGSAIVAVISFVLFLLIEKRESYPLIDLRLLGNKAILPSILIILIVGLSNFMVFQTIPILVRNPEPLGFGADVVDAGTIQLPFALVFLVFGPTSGLIISKLGSLRPVIVGTSIITVSFLGLVFFHDSPTAISINLGVLATGLSFAAIGAMNVIILATPKEYTGISLGIATLVRIIGSAIGPALAAMYMQSSQTVIDIGVLSRSYPSDFAFVMIFSTATVIAAGSIFLSVLLHRRASRMAIPQLS